MKVTFQWMTWKVKSILNKRRQKFRLKGLIKIHQRSSGKIRYAPIEKLELVVYIFPQQRCIALPMAVVYSDKTSTYESPRSYHFLLLM